MYEREISSDARLSRISAVVAGGNVESVSCRTTERKVIVVQHPEVAVTGMALRLSRSGD